MLSFRGISFARDGTLHSRREPRHWWAMNRDQALYEAAARLIDFFSSSSAADLRNLALSDRVNALSRVVGSTERPSSEAIANLVDRFARHTSELESGIAALPPEDAEKIKTLYGHTPEDRVTSRISPLGICFDLSSRDYAAVTGISYHEASYVSGSIDWERRLPQKLRGKVVLINAGRGESNESMQITRRHEELHLIFGICRFADSARDVKQTNSELYGLGEPSSVSSHSAIAEKLANDMEHLAMSEVLAYGATEGLPRTLTELGVDTWRSHLTQVEEYLWDQRALGIEQKREIYATYFLSYRNFLVGLRRFQVHADTLCRNKPPIAALLPLLFADFDNYADDIEESIRAAVRTKATEVERLLQDPGYRSSPQLFETVLALRSYYHPASLQALSAAIQFSDSAPTVMSALEAVSTLFDAAYGDAELVMTIRRNYALDLALTSMSERDGMGSAWRNCAETAKHLARRMKDRQLLCLRDFAEDTPLAVQVKNLLDYGHGGVPQITTIEDLAALLPAGDFDAWKNHFRIEYIMALEDARACGVLADIVQRSGYLGVTQKSLEALCRLAEIDGSESDMAEIQSALTYARSIEARHPRDEAALAAIRRLLKGAAGK